MNNNFSNASIFAITENDDCVFCSEYDSQSDGEILFIMLTNEYLNSEFNDNNTIYISPKYIWTKGENLDPLVFTTKDFMNYLLNNQNKGEFVWQADDNIIPNTKFYKDEDKIVYKDLNGFKNTANILNNAKYMLDLHNDINNVDADGNPLLASFGELSKPELMFPATFAAYTTTVIYNNKQYHGYLPSSGQLNIIFDNYTLIMRLYRFSNQTITKLTICNWQSSTENGITSIWGWCSLLNELCILSKESSGHCVMPLFALNQR